MFGGATAIRQRSIIPGFELSLGVTLSYLGLIVIIPLCVLLLNASDAGWAKIWAELSSPRTLAAFRVSFGIAFLAAAFNAGFGSIVAWVLVRYQFLGRRFIDAMIDLPFALPTAVAGISLTQLYAEKGWLGSALAATGHQGRLHTARHPGGARLRRPAIRRAHSATGTAGFRPRDRGSRRVARRLAYEHSSPNRISAAHSRGNDRVHARVCTRDRGVRLRHLHRRQHARLFRNRSAAHHHQARAVRLRRRNRDRGANAGGVLHPAIHHQPAAGLDSETARWLTTSRAFTRVRRRRRAGRCR